MSEIVNLRMHRKRKMRHQKEQQSAENRALFGRSKAERTAETAEADQARSYLDGHRLERGDRSDRH